MENVGITNIDTYIAGFAPEIQEQLTLLRETIKQAAPEAEEAIRYAMPTFRLHGNLVHFAAYKHHIGFYPAPSGISTFQDALSAYKTSKGAVQFPLNKPLPLDLVTDMVKFRVQQNKEKAAK